MLLLPWALFGSLLLLASLLLMCTSLESLSMSPSLLLLMSLLLLVFPMFLLLVVPAIVNILFVYGVSTVQESNPCCWRPPAL